MSVIKHSVSFLCRNIRYVIGRIIATTMAIDDNKVVFWADNFKHYGCNPKYISEALLKSDYKYKTVWVFDDISNRNDLLKEYKLVKYGTIQYLFEVNTAKYIITNQLIDRSFVLWKKRNNQKLIMTWHGTFALKRIMGDAHKQARFKKRMTRESNSCDIILSDSDWFSALLRRAFWYNGEILQVGAPRNDLFLKDQQKEVAVKRIRFSYDIPEKNKVILYAPTFRNNEDSTPYIKTWSILRLAFEKKLKQKVSVLVRLHPNMIGTKTSEEILDSDNTIIDVTGYDDMQELLCLADILITDYSTSMFDFSLNNRPCMLYVPDVETYDRGTYFPIENLPFPSATEIPEFIRNIEELDIHKTVENQMSFLKKTFNPILTGTASLKVVNWIVNN